MSEEQIQDSSGLEANLIAPGSQPVFSLPKLNRLITQELIEKYAQASGDFNPIHVDPEYSRTGPYGRTIAHGMMTLAYVGQMLNEWSSGLFDEAGEIVVAFLGPVFPGDTVEVSGVVEGTVEREGVVAILVRVSCQAEGRQILAGTAHLPLENRKGGQNNGT